MDDTKLDKYHYHELLDRAHVANDHFHEYVKLHKATQQNEELRVYAEYVSIVMQNFYQLCGNYIHKNKIE